MKNTRFMEVLFSAVENKDEELAAQVAKDIEDAKANGTVDTEEVKYENMGDGKVAVTDKGNGEVTIVEKASDESDTYDMYPAEQSEQIEGYLHPEQDGVTPGKQVGAADEKVENHMDGSSVIAPNMPCGGLNPEAGHEKSVEVTAIEGPDAEEKEFSVSTDNSVVLRIFSDQEFCERLFSEVIESEETAKVGDLKVEKVGPEEVVVTSTVSGDQAKVKMDGEDMEVTELESKTFSEEEEYEPLYVVGVDPVNHVIVDAPEYDEESAEELAQSLMEKGVAGVKIFDSPEEGRAYAIELLEGLGAQNEDDVEEPVQAEFSDHTIYLTKFYSEEDKSLFMVRMFSESIEGISDTQDAVEDAIENGDEIETDNEIITPIDSKTAIVEDKDSNEFTKASLEGQEIELEKINENQANELKDHIIVDEEGVDEDEEKKFSENIIDKYFSNTEDDIYTNDAQDKFFSENEEMTEYMVRLFSEECDCEEIEKAIESGEEVETDKEIITPISDTEAVVEDKENGEFTKATIDNDSVEVHPLTEEEAEKLEEKNEEKKFSEGDTLSKFFAEVVGAVPVAAGEVDPNTPVIPIADQNAVPAEPAQDVQDPTAVPVEGQVPSVEAIEDKALAAVQSIRAVADEAANQIMEAKQAPAPVQGEDLKEAQFSEMKFNDTNDTLVSWLNNSKR